MNMHANFEGSSVLLNYPDLTGREALYTRHALMAGPSAGPGHEALACETLISHAVGGGEAVLLPTCATALELAALMLDLAPGDEVIMPSFTSAATANAVVLRGGMPVFVDVDPVTFNIDPSLIEPAITARSRAVFACHYAGVPADMAAINAIAAKHELEVVEGAAQAYLSDREGHLAGNMARLACFSFHSTQNISAGDAGALIVNDAQLADRIEFLAGRGAPQRWQALGQSPAVSELTAAYLRAQLEQAHQITYRRLALWRNYQTALADLAAEGYFQLPAPPVAAEHNGHIFYLVLAQQTQRDALQSALAGQGIQAAAHYPPLHSSPAGKRFGRAAGPMTQTRRAAKGLLRLPLHAGMAHEQPRILRAIRNWVVANRHMLKQPR